jgi:hypothetical protein
MRFFLGVEDEVAGFSGRFELGMEVNKFENTLTLREIRYLERNLSS